MHHSRWSYNKTSTPWRRENPTFWRESESVWVWTTTLLCCIFLPVLVKAIPCIGQDLWICTVSYLSFTVELQQDGYTFNETFAKSEARNLPVSGCKSMVEGPTIMPGVFINLLCIYTMPNNHYCSTYMMAYHKSVCKYWLKFGRKSRSEG